MSPLSPTHPAFIAGLHLPPPTAAFATAVSDDPRGKTHFLFIDAANVHHLISLQMSNQTMPTKEQKFDVNFFYLQGHFLPGGGIYLASLT